MDFAWGGLEQLPLPHAQAGGLYSQPLPKVHPVEIWGQLEQIGGPIGF
jgi:hypothetical protein